MSKLSKFKLENDLAEAFFDMLRVEPVKISGRNIRLELLKFLREVDYEIL